MIDDARFFLGAPWPNYRRADWPTFMEVADALRKKHPRYVTTLHDVIVAGPPEAQSAVEAYWQGTVFSRLMQDREWLHNEKERLIAESTAASQREEQLRAVADSARASLAREQAPPVGLASRRLLKAVVPQSLQRALRRARVRR